MNRVADRVGRYFDFALFIGRKHLKGYHVDPTPSFDAKGLEYFQRVVSEASIYLEYGSGGSTLVASKYVDKLVSVESDVVFKKAVQRALTKTNCAVQLLTPNIGITREWGFPVFGRATKRRVARWRKYPQAPWCIVALKKASPDMILIDGRFRVACALETLLNVGRDSLMLVDDYVGRDYSIIERFAELIALHGRMAEFRRRTVFDEVACRKVLDISYANPL